MLDESLIGTPEPNTDLKCKLCGLTFENRYDDGTFNEDWESIDETGRCVDCYEEWGYEWPDRI